MRTSEKRERNIDHEEVKARMRLGEVWVIDQKRPPNAHLLIPSWFSGPLSKSLCLIELDGSDFVRLELRFNGSNGVRINNAYYLGSGAALRAGERRLEGWQVCETCLRGDFDPLEQDW